MKFQHIIETVYYKPWSITDAGWWDIHRIVKPHLLGHALPAQVQNFINARIVTTSVNSQDAIQRMEASDDSPERDFFGQPIEQFQVTPDGLAIIPVFGPLLNHASLMDRLCGACSYQQIQNDLKTAAATTGVKRAVMKIGSPGGMCNGMIETCKAILKFRETGIPIKAISDTMIGSAAYGLATCCDYMEITESTMIGSIGSFSAVLDSKKAYEIEGLLVEIFKSGEMKGAGIPGTSLSAEQRAEKQRLADYCGEQFREIVRSTREIDEKLMQGQVFIGADAIAHGFADKLIEDIGSGYAPGDYDQED